MKWLFALILAVHFLSCCPVPINDMIYEYGNGIKAKEVFIENQNGVIITISGQNGGWDTPLNSEMFVEIYNRSADTLRLSVDDFKMYSEEYEFRAYEHDVPSYIAPDDWENFKLRFIGIPMEKYLKEKRQYRQIIKVHFEFTNPKTGKNEIIFSAKE